METKTERIRREKETGKEEERDRYSDKQRKK